jgi:hypothetical protein
MKMTAEEQTGHKTKRHALMRTLEKEGDDEIKDYLKKHRNG